MNLYLVLAVVILGSFSNLSALTITLVGVADGPEVSSWRTSSISKTLDGDGDNIYGSLGYMVFTPIRVDGETINEACLENRLFSPYDDMRSLPEGMVVEPAAGWRQNFKYAEIDNPAKDGRIRCGALSAIVDGQSTIETGNANILLVTFGKAGSYRLGLLVDHMISEQFTADQFGLWNKNTGAVKCDIERNGVPKWVFFDVIVDEADVQTNNNYGCIFASFPLTPGIASLGAISIDSIK